MSPLNQEAVSALQARIKGEVIAPDEAGYDAARMAWNLTVQQHPAIIVTAADANDIAEAVRFASSQGLGVAVQATGHGVARPANDALLILTGNMQGVTIDAEAQTARIEAGVKWGTVLEMAQAHGLAPLLGSSPDVGAIGYTLGGGIGWLGRKYGLCVDSVKWFDVVTAAGEPLRASDTEHSDLFWGLRGGGGANYVIVTAMEVQLYPVSQVYAGNLLYPIDQARAVFQRYRDWIVDLPDEMTTSVLVMNFPPLPQMPEPIRGKSFAIVRGCYAGDLAEGQALIDPWRIWQAPAMDAFGPMPFSAAASISQDPLDPVPGFSNGAFLADLSDETIDTVLRYAVPQGGPPRLIKAEVHHAGGAINRARREDMAISHRSQKHLLQMVALTPTDGAYQAAVQHCEAFLTALGPHLTGARYPNFMDGVEQLAHVNAQFEADKFARLQALKAAYDPNGLFAYGFGVPR